MELHLRRLGAESEDGENAGAPESASDTEKEARMLGRRLLELKNQPRSSSSATGGQRDVKWSDMVVLMRSPRNKVECYVKEFAGWGFLCWLRAADFTRASKCATCSACCRCWTIRCRTCLCWAFCGRRWLG